MVVGIFAPSETIMQSSGNIFLIYFIQFELNFIQNLKLYENILGNKQHNNLKEHLYHQP